MVNVGTLHKKKKKEKKTTKTYYISSVHLTVDRRNFSSIVSQKFKYLSRYRCMIYVRSIFRRWLIFLFNRDRKKKKEKLMQWTLIAISRVC